MDTKQTRNPYDDGRTLQHDDPLDATLSDADGTAPVSYTHLTLPTKA